MRSMPAPSQIEAPSFEGPADDSRVTLTIDAKAMAIAVCPTTTVRAANGPDRSTATIATNSPPSSANIGQGSDLFHRASSTATTTPRRLAATISAYTAGCGQPMTTVWWATF